MGFRGEVSLNRQKQPEHKEKEDDPSSCDDAQVAEATTFLVLAVAYA